MTWHPKPSLTVETSHRTSSNMDSVPLHSSSRTLDHWATVHLLFSLAQVRCFWWCFCFRSGLVFLKISGRGDSWCTDSSFSSLLVKLSQVFESALLDSILKLVVIPVACAHFHTQLLPSSQLCNNMLWYSNPWTATPFCNGPLWLTLFVEGVNDCLLDHCQVSSLPHYYIVDKNHYKNKRYPPFKCFTLHVINLKYMKVLLFEVTRKKELFNHIQFFLDVPVYIYKVMKYIYTFFI